MEGFCRVKEYIFTQNINKRGGGAVGKVVWGGLEELYRGVM